MRRKNNELLTSSSLIEMSFVRETFLRSNMCIKTNNIFGYGVDFIDKNGLRFILRHKFSMVNLRVGVGGFSISAKIFQF